MMYKPKKSLGQNFLKSVPAINKIVEAGEISREDVVLEIGPGKGILTEKLLEKAGKVIAVEKDRDLFEFLKNKFSDHINSRSLVLVHDDILKFDMSKCLFDTHINYKIVANIPYNITGAILKKFLTTKNQPKEMVLMVQSEVAKRIVARDGKESMLSVSVKAYGEPKLIMKVQARYFSPAPKVDSAVISIKNISRKVFSPDTTPEARPQLSQDLETRFWEIVHSGFAHKRKKLSSNLRQLTPKTLSLELLESLGNRRAENLSVRDWINLTKVIK